jgi:hypothetical protein
MEDTSGVEPELRCVVEGEAMCVIVSEPQERCSSKTLVVESYTICVVLEV